jgi:hypothetical protein
MTKWRVYKVKYNPCDKKRDLPWRVVMPSGYVAFYSRSFQHVVDFYAPQHSMK